MKNTAMSTAERGSYGQYCPVALAAEIFCSRWTPLILRELLLGSRRFNDLRRGVPRLSPTLLSDRLRELQQAGIVTCRTSAGRSAEYCLTPAGQDLGGMIMGLAQWGTRWIDTRQSLANLDPTFLMWDMRRNIRPDPVPARRVVIQFCYPELPAAKRHFWLVIEGGEVDLCYLDPGFEVDLYIESALRTMTAVWMGASSIRSEMRAGRLEMTGDAQWRRQAESWLSLSPMSQLRVG